MPICGSELMNSAMEMHECGKLWTKFKVPSIGSITQVGVSVKVQFPPDATDSSPINRWLGNSALNVFINNFSILWSVSVTKSISLDLVSTAFSVELSSDMI